MTYTSLVERWPSTARMFAGLEASSAEDVERLLGDDPYRVIQSVIGTVHGEFVYTGTEAAPESFLAGDWSGDCATLAVGLVMAFRELGLDARVERQGAVLHIPAEVDVRAPGRTHGNVYEGGWIFTDHYWLSACGREWDPLFGGVDPGSVTKIERSAWELDEQGLPRHVFGGTGFYLTNDELAAQGFHWTTSPLNALDENEPDGADDGNAALAGGHAVAGCVRCVLI